MSSNEVIENSVETVSEEISKKASTEAEALDGKKKGGLWAALVQFIKFGLVGVMNTFISMAVNALVLIFFNKVLGISEDEKVSYFTASIMAFIISVFSAYIWQNKFVFKQNEGEERVWWKVLLKTYLSYAGTGLILNNILLYLWNDVIHVGQYFGWLVDIVNAMGISITGDRIVSYIAVLLNMVITVPLNFIFNKFWAYKGKKTESKEK